MSIYGLTKYYEKYLNYKIRFELFFLLFLTRCHYRLCTAHQSLTIVCVYFLNTARAILKKYQKNVIHLKTIDLKNL